MTFRTNLLLSMCGLVLVSGAAIFLVADRSSQESTSALADALFREVSRHAVTQTKDFVLRTAPVAESLEQLASQGLTLDDLDRLSHQLLAFLKGNPGLTWVLYGDESGDYTGAVRLRDGQLHIERTHMADGRSHLTEYEVQTDGSWKVFQEDDNRQYDPRNRPFYILAKEKGKLAWIAPYMFFSQGLPGISCVIPLYSAPDKLRGVFSVEFDLNALSEFVDGLSLSEHSEVFLFTPDGTLLAHPNQRNLAGKGHGGAGTMLTLADTGDPLVDAYRQHLSSQYLYDDSNSDSPVRQPEQTAGASRNTVNSAHDGFHFFQFNHDGVGYLASSTVFSIGDGQTWVVGAIAPQADFLSGVWRTRWLTLLAALGALGVAVVLAAALARRISGPVHNLIEFMHRVGGGDLEAQAAFHGTQEFRELSVAVNGMIADLRDRLRLRHSLDIAMEVQQQLLPRNAPVVEGFDIAGHSTYCDETGGDYYDFLVVDQPIRDHVFIAIGDVMGHGVAAALVMAGTRAVLRDRANATGSLAELMQRLNRMIAADLEGSRFMTMHLGVLDVKQRIYRWASAGHDPPIIYDPANNRFIEPECSSMPLGIMDDAEYDEQTFGPLSPGQIMFFGTDGVWEMPSPAGDQFGKDRLREIIRFRSGQSRRNRESHSPNPHHLPLQR